MNKIIFTPIENNSELVIKYVNKPTKSSSVVPDWFKKIPRFQENDKKMVADKSTGYHNLTVRHCMPFLDAMTSGYFLTTWTDIHVFRKDGNPIISYGDNEKTVEFGYGQVQYQKYFQSHIATMPGFDPFSYAWSTYWRIKTPEGVSCLFTHPLNRTDLPFFTLSGITDTDNWHGSDVLNFALKEGFEGTIPKGTPYVQIIPFYRDEWNHEVLDSPNLEHKIERDKVNDQRYSEIKSGYYRDNLWNKKEY
jgi:hypothetical protein